MFSADFSRENSKETDAAKDKDFRRAAVTVKSQQS